MTRDPLGATHLRAATDADADSLADLVASAYAEYPGCVLDLPGVDRDLVEPGTTAARRGGRWWILERDEAAVASIGTSAPDADGLIELKRLYLDQRLRGRGLATRLVTRVESHAAGLGATAIELWSDTRFVPAHRRYTALGYTPTGQTRELHDPSDTTEYRFTKPLPPGAPSDDAPHTVFVATGEHGGEEVEAISLPDGEVVRGELGGSHYELEVDQAWRARRIVLRTPGGRVTITTDGLGRWWWDGEPCSTLDGCTDLALLGSPVGLRYPIRRHNLGTGATVELRLAVLTATGGTPGLDDLHVAVATLERKGMREHRLQQDERSTTVLVAADGFPERVGSSWQRH